MKKKFYFKADKESGIEANIFGAAYILEVVRQNNLQHIFKFPFYGLTFDHKRHKVDEWINQRQYAHVSDKIIRHITRYGLKYFIDVRQKMIRQANHIFVVAKKVPMVLSDLNDSELVQRYYEFITLYHRYYGLGAITFLYESIVSDRLYQSLSKRYPAPVEYLKHVLKTPYNSFMLTSEKMLLSIAQERIPAKKKRLIDQYQHDFFFMRSNFAGSKIIASADVSKMASQSLREKSPLQKATGRTAIALLKQEKMIVSLLKETEIIRDQRKKINLIGSFILFRFLDEACRRKHISSKIAVRMFWFEFKDLFSQPKELVNVLKRRIYGSVVLSDGQDFYLDYIAIRPRQTAGQDVTECRGTPASTGKAVGRVCIVFGSKDFKTVRRGDVLITEMTRPDFMPIVQKVGAIITDEGGLMCHAAIVARELRRPCIVGTHNATRIFKNGDRVEVDATNGIIKRLTKK